LRLGKKSGFTCSNPPGPPEERDKIANIEHPTLNVTPGGNHLEGEPCVSRGAKGEHVERQEEGIYHGGAEG